MNYDDILTAVEKHLEEKGDKEGLKLIENMVSEMRKEEEDYWLAKESKLTEEEINQILWEEEEEREETHWYTDQPISKSSKRWVDVKNGSDEYALVEYDRDGSVTFHGFHTT